MKKKIRKRIHLVLGSVIALLTGCQTQNLPDWTDDQDFPVICLYGVPSNPYPSISDSTNTPEPTEGEPIIIDKP